MLIAAVIAIAASSVWTAGLAPADASAAGGPLEIADAALTQTDVRMTLRIATSGEWTSQDIVGSPGRSLCITLVQGDPSGPRGRICVTRANRRTALSYTPLALDGVALAPRPLAAVVSRADPRVLEASFLPVAVDLAVGPYAWYADSTWTDQDSCANTCSARFPDGDGVVSAQLALLAYPPCFGAASRDPRLPCDNPDLRLTLEPTLARANAVIDSYCDTRELVGLLSACEFGAAPDVMAGAFALIGDSHAATLKTALHVVALGKRWRGVSIVRSGCPATLAPAPILQTAALSRQCARWNRQVLDWLRTHPEVKTAFLSAHATARVSPRAGQSKRAAVEAGYRAEIRALLKRVRRVVVIRDTPESVRGHLGCIANALAAGTAPGPACAQPRARVVKRDPLVVAARAVGSSRVRVIDLTPQICDRARCYPVVGGALVHRDAGHFTPAFSASLGPLILRTLGG